jgi:hypothetical protein
MKATLRERRSLQIASVRMPWLSIDKKWPVKLKVATRVRIAAGLYRQSDALR